jgi:hypothetical protein
VLTEQDKVLGDIRLSKSNGKERIEFSIDATRHEHSELTNYFRREPGLSNIQAVAGPEIE